MIPWRTLIKTWRVFLPAILLAVSLLSVYLYTLAPGLTWAHHGSDGGDLIAAAATGGVPHPTGYPLYLVLAGIFQILPVGSLAYRTNLMSAVFASLASVLIYRTVVRHLAAGLTLPVILAGLAAGYAFGLAPLVWSQAVITEVYTLQAFLVCWIIHLYSGTNPDSAAKQIVRDRWCGLALGLALANHMTSLLLIPLALLLGSVHEVSEDPERVRRPRFKNYRFDLHSLGRQALWMGAGLCLYLTLPLRALSHPPINWGNPLTLSRFWWLVSGKLYQGVYVQSGIYDLWPQLWAWMDFAWKQMGFLAIVVALASLILLERVSRLVILTVWMAITSLIFVSFYHPLDAEVYMIPVLISISIWLGIATGRLAAKLSQRSPALSLGLVVMVLGTVLLRPVSYFHQVDASQDIEAESVGREVLSTAPKNAILFAQGDKAIFALWYFHFALHERPDLVVLADELLPYDWYQETLRSVYPNLNLPGSLLWPETIAQANNQRPVCTVRYSAQALVNCQKLSTVP